MEALVSVACELIFAFFTLGKMDRKKGINESTKLEL